MSTAVLLKTAFDLVVKAAAKNELSVQIGGWKRVPEKDEPPGSTQNVGAVLPELLKYGRRKVLQVRWRNYERSIAFPRFGLYPTGAQKGVHTVPFIVVMEYFCALQVGHSLQLCALIPVKRAVRL